MFVRSVLSVFKRELREVAKSRLYLAVLVLLPLVMLLLFTVMFYRGTINELPITVVDNDKTPMSRQLCSMIDATPGVEIAFSAQSMDDAERQMLSSEALAVLYIERGFESDIYAGIPTKVECYLPGTNISASGVIERDIQQAVLTFSSGVALNRMAAVGIGHSQSMVNIMPIKILTNTIGNPYINYGYYLAPVFMFMGVVIFIVVSTVYAFGRELRYATAREWLSTANDSLAAAVVGKMLPTTIAMVINLQLAMLVIFVVMGMECAGSYLELSLGSLIFIIAYQSVAIAIVTLTSNLRLGLSIGGGYAVMAFTFSGITFPVMAMYDVAQWFSKLFPLTYFSNIFVDKAMLGVGISYDIDDYLAMAVFMLLVPLVWRRLSRVVGDSKYWCRD